MTIVERLRAAGCVFAEDEAALLVEAAGAPDQLEALVLRRIAGEPLEVIVGWAAFAGLRINVEPRVFVPRRRTEIVAASAIALNPGTLVDLCCGTGAVGAVVLARVPGVDVYASDIEAAAVRCARRNLPADHVFEGDLFDALPIELRGRIDIVVANAPYVPTDEIGLMPSEARDHEPLVTLDGGRDGLDIQRRVAAAAPQWLVPGGHLLIETSRRQSHATVALFEEAGFDARIEHDPDVDGTVVIGTLR